jgi:hypothetical protein
VAEDAEVAGGVEERRQRVTGDAERTEQARVPIRLTRHRELGPRRGREVGGKAGTEPVAQVRVDRAEPQGSALGGVDDALLVVEKPGELARREVGIEGQAAPALHLRPDPV